MAKVNRTVLHDSVVTVHEFITGGTVRVPTDYFKDSTGLWQWGGAVPKIVPSGSTPESTGGTGTGAWIRVSDASLRNELSSYVTLKYTHANGQSAIDNMQLGFPSTAKVGDVVSTGGTLWLRENSGGTLNDFRPLTVIDISDWGALGIADDTIALQAGIDFADSINHPCTAPTSAKFKISKGLTFKNSGFSLSQINLVAMSNFNGDAMVVSEYSGTGNSRVNVKLKKLNLDCAENAKMGFKFSGIGQGSCFNDFNITNCITGGVFVGCWSGEVANLRVRGRGKDLGGAGLSMGVPGSALPGYNGANQVNMMYIHGGAISHVYDGFRLHYGVKNIITGVNIEYTNVPLEARYPDTLSFTDNYIEVFYIAAFQLGSSSTTTLPLNCIISGNYFNNPDSTGIVGAYGKFKCGTDCVIENNRLRNTKLDLTTPNGQTSKGNKFVVNKTDVLMGSSSTLNMNENLVMTPTGETFIVNSLAGTSTIGCVTTYTSDADNRALTEYKSGGAVTTRVGRVSSTNNDFYIQGIETNVRLGGKTSVKPIYDNANSFGEPSQRWTDGYFVNAPTVSSDRNLKTTPESIPEVMLLPLLEIVDNIVLWKWISSVNAKGASARKHVGIIAQDVYAVFSNYGIDAFEYGFIGKDKTDAGEIWSVRASELQWLCLWALGKRQRRIEQHLGLWN